MTEAWPKATGNHHFRPNYTTSNTSLQPHSTEEKNAILGILHPVFNVSLTGTVYLLTEKVFWILNAGHHTRKCISDTYGDTLCNWISTMKKFFIFRYFFFTSLRMVFWHCTYWEKKKKKRGCWSKVRWLWKFKHAEAVYSFLLTLWTLKAPVHEIYAHIIII